MHTGCAIQGLSLNTSSRILVDINSAATSAPEPQSYGLVLAGLGVIGFALRRRANAAR
jgi:hypothetical protein